MNVERIKPSALFLGKFLGFYLLTNLLYGWYVETYAPSPDLATVTATHQAASLLRTFGFQVKTIRHHSKPAERIILDTQPVLSVFEGCNGINIAIIFLAFLFAFSSVNKTMVLYALVGTLIIYLANIGRIISLFFVSLKYPENLYFFHKYFFTAVLYGIVFCLWYVWIVRYAKRSAEQ